MFEGSRLSYIVPGYTGHIPHQIQNDPIQSGGKQPQYQIPGYQGFISSIQSENLFANTYGKITHNISKNDYHKGQDVPREIRYTSIQQQQYVNQGQVVQRSAAEVVGVHHEKTNYRVTLNQCGRETLQGTEYKNKIFEQKNENQQNPNQPLALGTPLPGYTGVIKRVTASNIFGQTYANSMRTAHQDEDNINRERRFNIENQSSQIPPIKK